jgi:hypothetical protein
MRKIDSWANDARAWTQMWMDEIDADQLLPLHRQKYANGVPNFNLKREIIIDTHKSIAQLLSR